MRKSRCDMVAIAIEEIQDNIRAMGYITATPRGIPTPSFYKLGDGTILSVLTRINHLLQHPSNPNNVSMNSGVDIHVFVDSKNRNPAGKQSSGENPTLSIIDEDLQCDPLLEEFNVYDLSNGKIMSVKTIVAQVRKTDLHNDTGEPIYQVDSQPVIKFKNGPNS